MSKIVNKKFSKLKVKKHISKHKVLCECDCGNIVEVYSNNLYSKKTKSCGCNRFPKRENHHSFRGVGELSGKYIYRIKQNAKSRKISFNISPKQLWQLFLKQNRKCALTGLDLQFSTTEELRDGTASLDRINSKRGYIISNVQWVHKDINELKWDKTYEQLVDLCQKIVNYKNRKK